MIVNRDLDYLKFLDDAIRSGCAVVILAGQHTDAGDVMSVISNMRSDDAVDNLMRDFLIAGEKERMDGRLAEAQEDLSGEHDEQDQKLEL